MLNSHVGAIELKHYLTTLSLNILLNFFFPYQHDLVADGCCYFPKEEKELFCFSKASDSYETS